MQTFKHGDRVKATIKGKKIEDAKISIDKYGIPSICQNKVAGFNEYNEFGYVFTWQLDKDFTEEDVSDLRLAEKTFDNLEVGDIVYNEIGERKILFVGGLIYVLSDNNDFDTVCGTYTKQELIDANYKIKPEPEIPEVTMEEVCEKFGREVKIKK